MKVLFIGGTGVISSACSHLAIERGIDLFLLNRGETATRPIPAGAKRLNGDIRNRDSAVSALGEHCFDAVVDWVAFTPAHVATDIELFRDRTAQYLFISSASAYRKPLAHLPITESTTLSNPYWQYSRDKIACEELLVRAFREEHFPMTIVRPSHTYDRTKIPVPGGYTALDRMRRGKPALVHGDGSSLWVLTHHADFAKAFVPLLGNDHAIGEAFHITADQVLTWDQIFNMLAQALGVEAQLTHVPSETIVRFWPDQSGNLLGDKTHSVLFDNNKIKRLVPDFAATIPFSQGAREIVEWYLADPARQVIDPALDALMDQIIAAQEQVRPHAG